MTNNQKVQSVRGPFNIDLIKEKINDLTTSIKKFKKFYELTEEQISEITYSIPAINPSYSNEKVLVNDFQPMPNAPITNEVYSTPFAPKTQPSITVNHYHDHSIRPYDPTPFYLPYLFSQPRTETIVINNCNDGMHNRKTKKDNNESENKKSQLANTNEVSTAAVAGALVGVAAVAFVGTYIVSKDEYILFYMSKSFSQIKDLNNLVKGTEFEIEFMMLEHQFNRWAEEFGARSGKKLLGKGFVITSGMVGLSGLYFGTSLIVSGFVGATVSGCYLLWNYMTSDREDELKHFKNLLQKIADFDKNLVSTPNANLIDFMETEKQPEYGELDIPIEPYNPIYPDLNRLY